MCRVSRVSLDNRRSVYKRESKFYLETKCCLNKQLYETDSPLFSIEAKTYEILLKSNLLYLPT